MTFFVPPLKIMLDKTLFEASRICASIPSFGEVLGHLRQERNLSQKELSKWVYRSEAEVSRLLNNQIPKKLGVSDVHQLADCLKCSPTELARLVEAFVCHILSDREMIDLDLF